MEDGKAAENWVSDAGNSSLVETAQLVQQKNGSTGKPSWIHEKNDKGEMLTR